MKASIEGQPFASSARIADDGHFHFGGARLM
jgi:hypothetical protein